MPDYISGLSINREKKMEMFSEFSLPVGKGQQADADRDNSPPIKPLELNISVLEILLSATSLENNYYSWSDEQKLKHLKRIKEAALNLNGLFSNLSQS
ncbi:MAG: hypothetical protein SAL07_23175 [Oscillatoria sp. PMC 1051.18]|nr:hypothetical protein [Oscillatoria sp. PMC 1050.18]MEC5032815.1 hypothetical protein [Oscillatoria sp. PMC 1051.18]